MAPQRVAIVCLEWDLVDLVESLGHEPVGFFDQATALDAGHLRHLGPDSAWTDIRKDDPDLKVVLGCDASRLKPKLYRHYGADAWISVLSPFAHVSRHATLGSTHVVQRGVSIMPRAVIGDRVKLNVNATVHHDCRVSDDCTIAPGAQLLGNVALGQGVFVGAGAVIRQHCTVGPFATIGAGAVVVADVPEGAIVVGVPARPIQR